MTRGSLQLRLLLAGAVSIAAALLLSGLGLTLLFERHVERRVEAELAVHLDQIVAGLERDATGTLIISTRPQDPRFAEPLSGLYWQLQISETFLRSRSLWDTRLALPPDRLADGALHRHRVAGPAGSELVVLERSVVLPRRLGGGSLRAAVALDAAEIAAATRAFAMDLLPYLALIAVFLMAAAYGQVVIGLRPLAAVRRQLAAIRAGEARRLGEEFPDEVLPLAVEIDGLLGAREAQVEKARARAGDLAHGLKTPLQVLAGDLERLRAKGESEIARDIEQVATTMRRHVDRELARARVAVAGPAVRANVAEVVERLVAVVARTPAGSRLRWSLEIPAETKARIDPDDLAEAVGNLLENAARHACARVSIRTGRRGGQTVITVADDGPGILRDRLEDVLLRGCQLDRSSEGPGLGLAIVRDIAEAWGGQLALRSSASGLEVDLAMPG